MKMLVKLWHRAFLVERPSASMGLFRLAVAFTVGAHMIPSFLHMGDNYLATAFRTKNYHFFPIPFLQAAEASPDWLVWTVTVVFFFSLAAFTIGLFSRLSCIVMTLACYYFYALNPYHIGTLSFDILLVTLFLMCVTGYHGDFLSIDSLRSGDTQPHRRLRPFFLQRLLQLQLAWTFLGTALSKITGDGNWLTGNPYYALMHYPKGGVVRDFPLRDWLAQQPDLCYWLGVILLFFEFALPVLWFLKHTRIPAIVIGIAFQLMLWITLQVPTIFLFLFPPMMLLFIPPEHVVDWIDRRRERNQSRAHGILIYDGLCGFCLESIKRLQTLDLFEWIQLKDFQIEQDLSELHAGLTPERCKSEIMLIEPGGRLTGGFDAFRRLSVRLPLLRLLSPLLYIPGVPWIGRRTYRWIADHRYLLHRGPVCSTNQCGLHRDSSSNT